MEKKERQAEEEYELLQAAHAQLWRQAEEEYELLQAAHAQLWTQVFSFTHSQTLRCAVELHIPDIIHAHAGPTTLSHLASRLPLPSSPDRLRRLMCFLSHLNFFKHTTMITRVGGDQSEEMHMN
ncbi:hypothetical protein AAC387_Pa09g0251 [Persea americana]